MKTTEGIDYSMDFNVLSMLAVFLQEVDPEHRHMIQGDFLEDRKQSKRKPRFPE